MAPLILPAGQHYGTTLRNVTIGEITLACIRYDAGTSSAIHGNERASVMFVRDGLCLKQIGSQALELDARAGMFLPPARLQRDVFPGETTFLAAEFSPSLFGRLTERQSLSTPDLVLLPAATEQLRSHRGLFERDPILRMALRPRFPWMKLRLWLEYIRRTCLDNSSDGSDARLESTCGTCESNEGSEPRIY